MNKLLVCAFALIGCVAEISDGGPGGGGGSGGGGRSGGGGGGTAPAGLIFSAYKDTSINMDWNTNVISTMVSGTRTRARRRHGRERRARRSRSRSRPASAAARTGAACPARRWRRRTCRCSTANNIDYILATGGAAGSFTCGTDAGMKTFLDSLGLAASDRRRLRHRGRPERRSRSASSIQRINAAHTAYPTLRFSLTLATLANNNGALDGAVARRGGTEQLQRQRRSDAHGREVQARRSTARRDVAELRHGQPDDDGLRRAEPGRVRRRERRVRHGPVGDPGRVQPARPLGRAVRRTSS